MAGQDEAGRIDSHTESGNACTSSIAPIAATPGDRRQASCRFCYRIEAKTSQWHHYEYRTSRYTVYIVVPKPREVGAENPVSERCGAPISYAEERKSRNQPAIALYAQRIHDA